MMIVKDLNKELNDMPTRKEKFKIAVSLKLDERCCSTRVSCMSGYARVRAVCRATHVHLAVHVDLALKCLLFAREGNIR